jgi:hypothetical protein
MKTWSPIAEAVAGRFDHYICRRDDSLRDRAPDEVPRIQAAALRASGVSDSAISIIPDEQEAIDAALRMGQPGDLLLVFAGRTGEVLEADHQVPRGVGIGRLGCDCRCAALTFAATLARVASERPGQRSRQSPPGVRGPAMGRPRPQSSGIGGFIAKTPPAPLPAPEPQDEILIFAGEASKDLPGVIRDERGVRLAPEVDD